MKKYKCANLLTPWSVLMTEPRTILILEDEPVVMEVLERILLSSGFRLLEARSAEEAIRQFRQNRDEIDLLIADVGIPGGSGIEIALACWLQSSNLRLVISTGLPMCMWTEEDQNTFRRLPPHVALLVKPFYPAEFLELVNTILSRPRAVAQS